jgi:glycerol 3-phosphatase-2
VSLGWTDRPLADVYDAALVDLDGVVYVGDHAVPGAAAAVDAVRERGMRVVFVTNNASRTPDAVAERLRGLGVPADAGDVVTSAQAVGTMLAERFAGGSPVLVVGAEGLLAEVRRAGMRPVSSADDRPVAVVQGYGPDVSWRALAEAAVAVRRGATWIASNADRTLPSSRGQLPGNGALVNAVRCAVDVDPLVAGKPCPPLHREAVRRVAATRPLVVGDRLDTDIEGARNVGCDSLLVLSGVTDLPEAAAAPPGRRPTYLGTDLSALLGPAPKVSTDGERATCRGATARLAGERVVADGDPDDARRASLALCWALADSGQVASIDQTLSRRPDGDR